MTQTVGVAAAVQIKVSQHALVCHSVLCYGAEFIAPGERYAECASGEVLCWSCFKNLMRTLLPRAEYQESAR